MLAPSQTTALAFCTATVQEEGGEGVRLLRQDHRGGGGTSGASRLLGSQAGGGEVGAEWGVTAGASRGLDREGRVGKGSAG